MKRANNSTTKIFLTSLSFVKKSFYFSPFYLFIFPTPNFNLNFKFPFFQKNHKTFQTHHIISKQKQHPFPIFIFIFHFKIVTKPPKNFINNYHVFSFFIISNVLSWRGSFYRTKLIKSKFNYSIYSWLFSTIQYYTVLPDTSFIVTRHFLYIQFIS